jgi:hypothetical protein
MTRYPHWKNMRKRSKIVTVSLVIALAVLSVVSIDGYRSMNRRNAVRKMLSAYLYDSRYQFQVKGPFSMAQVEKQLFGGHRKSPEQEDDAHGSSERPHAGSDNRWRRIESNYKAGDELYFFKSDEDSWAQLEGIEGIVLVRKDHIVAYVLTKLN